MKKIFSVIFLFLLFSIIPFNNFLVNAFTLNQATSKQNDVLSSKSKAALLMDYNSGEIVYSHNINTKYPIASMCKIMTLLLSFENIDAQHLSLNEKIEISENASGMGGSQAFIEAHEQYELGNLIKSVVIASANDSCVALAEYFAGSEQLFIQKMNDRASELGMLNTRFSNCTGLPKPDQYSSAKDVSIMLKELLKHKDYFKYSRIWMDDFKHNSGRITGLTNTNKLIRFYEGCDSGKTGFTNEAGHCLASSAKRGDMRLISVIIGAPDGKTRFEESKTLFNYGFATFVNKLLIDKTKEIDEKLLVKNSKQKQISIVPECDFYKFSSKTEKDNIIIDINFKEKIKAPIKKGDVVGEINIFNNNIEIGKINLLANENADAKKLFDSIKDIANNWNF